MGGLRIEGRGVLSRVQCSQTAFTTVLNSPPESEQSRGNFDTFSSAFVGSRIDNLRFPGPKCLTIVVKFPHWTTPLSMCKTFLSANF